MRKLILLFLGLFLLSSFVGGDKDVITWSKDRKLTWKDYRGKPKPRFAAASTVYSLGRYVDGSGGKATAVIEAYFYCNDSWKKDDWINDEVLAHEQKHFDIVELFARKIRKKIDSMTFGSLKEAEEKVESLYQGLNKEMDVYQDLYDKETDGSMDGDGQRKWEKKIAEEIKSLDAYASKTVVLKIKSGN